MGLSTACLRPFVTYTQTSRLLSPGGRQRSNSTYILGAVRMMTRLETVTETLRHALNMLAATALDEQGYQKSTTTMPTWAES